MTFLKFEKFCKQNKLEIFTINDLRVLFHTYSAEYIRLKVSRWKEKGYLISPKRGLYILEGAMLDEFEIASQLISPSYISMETALSHYSIIPDVSAEVSSMTTKNTRTFNTGKNLYKFYHIKQSLYGHFVHLKNGILIASPEKAILDFLYIKNPDKNHLFFERINKETIKILKLKNMGKLSVKFPPHTQKLFHYFKNVITR